MIQYGAKTDLKHGSGNTGGAWWDRVARKTEIRKTGGFESHCECHSFFSSSSSSSFVLLFHFLLFLLLLEQFIFSICLHKTLFANYDSSCIIVKYKSSLRRIKHSSFV